MISFKPNFSFRSLVEPALILLLRLLALSSAGVMVLIFGFVGRESWPVLQHVGLGRLFADPSWHPAAAGGQGTFNLAPMIGGTFFATLLAILLAAPLGLLSAVFCHFYAPDALARIYRLLLELLAGIPSVVYGFWGLVVLVPLIRALHPPGPSLLAAALVLAIMVLPMIALTIDAAFAAVPNDYWLGAAALGLSRWRMLSGVILPAARSSIYSGILLATCRALGETMAVLLVCGNLVALPGSIFDPIRTLTANIALEMGYALGDHRSALFASGLLLLVLVCLLVLLAERFARQVKAA